MRLQSTYNRPLWFDPYLDPKHNGSLVHQTAIFLYETRGCPTPFSLLANILVSKLSRCKTCK
ncbi:hypothetical protein R3W88_030281 [Solanum pinnatisectum]|uniref:Uncharacterized protein n=1 Tax=Solanum pinnatisectum TaxID=50273 RepID=A0AAV9K845_9SOLN|nr:hypothetical protein R3W88_030281 [Solanum pinnatisectum]